MRDSDAADQGRGRIELNERQYQKKFRAYSVGAASANSGTKLDDLVDVFERLMLDVDASWRDKKISDLSK